MQMAFVPLRLVVIFLMIRVRGGACTRRCLPRNAVRGAETHAFVFRLHDFVAWFNRCFTLWLAVPPRVDVDDSSAPVCTVVPFVSQESVPTLSSFWCCMSSFFLSSTGNGISCSVRCALSYLYASSRRKRHFRLLAEQTPR